MSLIGYSILMPCFTKRLQFSAVEGLFALLVLAVLSLTPRLAEADCAQLEIKQGQVNLSCWNGETVRLKGDWILSYKDRDSDYQYNGPAPLPGIWRSLNFEPALSPFGRGRYTLEIRALDITQQAAHKRQLGVLLSRNNAARRILIKAPDLKEQLLFDSGAYDSSDTLNARMRNDVVPLPNLGPNFTLIVETSNTAGRNGGMAKAPVLGNYETLVHKQDKRKSLALILSTIFVVFALINLFLYMAKKHDYSLILLSLMSLCLGIRSALTSNAINDLFPNISAQLDSTVGWISFLFGTALAAHYFRISYPKLVPRWLIVAPLLLSTMALFAFLFLPLIVVQTFGDLYRPVMGIVFIGLLIALSLGLKTGDLKLKVTVFGCAFICGMFALDIVQFQLSGTDTHITATSIACLVFMASQTALMSRRYYTALSTSAKLTEELVDLTSDLEKKVKQRTIELEKKNRQLDKLAHLDRLTQVGNRRALEETAKKELDRLERSNSNLVVALLDLDHFKIVNDNYGHAMGDRVLVESARILKENLRTIDTISRWGGEEFCIIFPDTDRATSSQIALRLCKCINDHVYTMGESNFSVSASFGMSSSNYKRPLEELIHEADQALYQAKNGGRNTVVRYWDLNPLS